MTPKVHLAQAQSRLSVSEITTIHAGFDEDVAAYAAAGLGGIGVWGMKLTGRRSAEAAALIARAGLRVTNVVLEGNSIFPNALTPDPADPRQRTDALIERCEAIACLRPDTVVVVTGVDPGAPVAATRHRCVTELRRLTAAARELGLTLALEPMHVSAAEDFSFINSLADAAALIADVRLPGLGILYDTWHMGQSPGAAGELRTFIDLVVGVHVADVHTPTRSWADRSFPGEGTLPLESLIGELEDGGYAGSYDVEIFSDDGTFGQSFIDSLWQLPTEACLTRALALLRHLPLRPQQPAKHSRSGHA